jgi:transcriptional/translational regulatory protein YebC/TACO1
VIVEAITDSSTRTAAELRNLFEKFGGTLGTPGSVSYLFTRVGEIELPKDGQNFEAVFEKALAAGAEDIEETADSFLIYTKVEDLHRVGEALGKTGTLSFRSNKETMLTLSAEQQGKLDELLSALDELDDVQEVYTNAA